MIYNKNIRDYSTGSGLYPQHLLSGEAQQIIYISS